MLTVFNRFVQTGEYPRHMPEKPDFGRPFRNLQSGLTYSLKDSSKFILFAVSDTNRISSTESRADAFIHRL